MSEFEQIIEAQGHLVDSGIMSKILDRIIENHGSFEVESFSFGKTNEDMSRARIKVSAPGQADLNNILQNLSTLGCYIPEVKSVQTKAAPKDACVPEDFYSTTNHKTYACLNSQWVEVTDQRMDAVIRIENDTARCVKLRDIRQGEAVVCGIAGIKVIPEFKERDRSGFAFMANEISSERRVEIAVVNLARILQETKNRGGKIVAVPGPVVVHTGGVTGLSALIRKGYVRALLGGNAIAVHDIENALFHTSLGVDLRSGCPVDEGHKNHMRAINIINGFGGIRQAVEAGALKSGIMYECVVNKAPFVLAGSIRDDGPLPETVNDMIEAQRQYAELLRGAELVLIMASMLHGIGTGNMIPSWVKTICIDINPAVVTKLSDRGSSQAIGIVTDVGLFLHLLESHI